MVTRSLLPGRSTSIELTPADFSRAAQRFLQLQVFLQQLGVALLGEPARAPRLVEAQPESVRMNFLSHLCFFLRHLDDDMRHRAADTGRRGPSAPAGRASCAALRSRTPRKQTAGPRPRPRTGSARWRWPTAAPSPPSARCACWWCAAWSAPPRPSGRGSGPPPAAPSAGRFGCICASAFASHGFPLMPAWTTSRSPPSPRGP